MIALTTTRWAESPFPKSRIFLVEPPAGTDPWTLLAQGCTLNDQPARVVAVHRDECYLDEPLTVTGETLRIVVGD